MQSKHTPHSNTSTAFSNWIGYKIPQENPTFTTLSFTVWCAEETSEPSGHTLRLLTFATSFFWALPKVNDHRWRLTQIWQHLVRKPPETPPGVFGGMSNQGIMHNLSLKQPWSSFITDCEAVPTPTKMWFTFLVKIEKNVKWHEWKWDKK